MNKAIVQSRPSLTGQDAYSKGNPAGLNSALRQGRNSGCNTFMGEMPKERLIQLPDSIPMMVGLILLSPIFLLLCFFEIYLHPKRYSGEFRSRRNHEAGQS